MTHGENKRAEPPKTQGETDELAKDVAHLYSWANVEDAAYLDFSRQRKQHPEHIAPPIVPLGESPKTASDGGTNGADAVSFPAHPVTLPGTTQEDPGSGLSLHSSPGTSAGTSAGASPGPIAEHSGVVAFEPRLASRPEDLRPAVALYSLAGGVGRTTMCANLGRVLCSKGERVLLVDACGSGLLPFYFGATEIRGGLRTFQSPETDFPPLQIIGADDVSVEWLEDEVQPAMQACHRTIFDLGPASANLLPHVLGTCGVLMVPLLSDLHSIVTVSRVEASVKTMQDRGIRVPSPFYVFNRLDDRATSQRARETIVGQCSERLLPMTVRQSHEIPEAFDNGMTVSDYAPASPVTQDYMEFALWLRRIAPACQTAKPPGRWVER
jgi:cellulose biosynthesis protein BcsQ